MSNGFRLPRVYPVTDTQVSGLSHAEQVEMLNEGGASLVQLREKRSPARDFLEQAQRAMEVARQRGVQILINDRPDIALAVGALGVHLGQDDFPPEGARLLLGAGGIIGYSTHSLDQARAAALLPVDYIAIGPIFKTSTKADTDSHLGLEALRAVRAAVRNIPLAAIGGITLNNARQVIEAGADSVAVISAVLANPGTVVEAMQALIQSLPRPV